jgi:hypothetical protein
VVTTPVPKKPTPQGSQPNKKAKGMKGHNGYSVYSQEVRPGLKAASTTVDFGEVSKTISSGWHALEDGERDEYNKTAAAQRTLAVVPAVPESHGPRGGAMAPLSAASFQTAIQSMVTQAMSTAYSNAQPVESAQDTFDKADAISMASAGSDSKCRMHGLAIQIEEQILQNQLADLKRLI